MAGELTLNQIVDRIRAVCEKVPFNLKEAQAPFSFALTPSQTIDGSFRVETRQVRVTGQFMFREDRVDDIDIWVAMSHGQQGVVEAQNLRAMAHSLTAAVVFDAALQGDYDVRDDTRGVQIQADQGASYLMMRLTLPVQYIAALA